MAAVASKRACIRSLLSGRNVNRSDALATLNRLAPETHITEEDVRATTREVMTYCAGKVRVLDLDGAPVVITIARLQLMLPFALARCPGFEKMFSAALARSGNSRSSPFRLVLYLDDITPGNVLKLDNLRKVTAIYASFLELGNDLRYEESWFVVAVIRVSLEATIAGGMSCVIKELLNDLFLGPDSLDLAGIPIARSDGTILFFATFACLIADEAALKSVVGSKSSAGTLCCYDCKNVLSIDRDADGTRLVPAGGDGYLVTVRCVDPAKFDSKSDADVWSAVDALAAEVAGGASQARLRTLERAYGMNFVPDGVLASAPLRRCFRPARCFRDPMHIVLANGVANIEVFMFLRWLAASMEGFSWDMLRGFAKTDWHIPRERRKSMAHVFNDKHETSTKKDKTFKGSASEMLVVLYMLRHFVLTVVLVATAPSREVDSFLALCKVVDLMQRAKARCTPAVLDRLESAVAAFRRAHELAYGAEEEGLTKPKHHYMFHMASAAREIRFWLDCFVHERKHQIIKASIRDIHNNNDYEFSCLEMVLLKTFALQETVETSALLPPVSLSEPLTASFGARCDASRRMRVGGVSFSEDSIVAFGGGMYGWIKACCRVGGEFGLLVRSLVLVSEHDSYSILRLGEEEYRTAPPAGDTAVMWYHSGGGTLTALW